MGWMLLGVAALLGWGIGGGILVERRLWPWIVRRARGRAGRAAAVSIGVQLTGLAVFAVLAFVGVVVAEVTGRTVMAAYGVVPACLVYMPVLMVGMPGEATGLRTQRTDMESVGATRQVARAAAWAGVPFVFLGVSLVFAALFGTFLT
jgi:hypothetical protein